MPTAFRANAETSFAGSTTGTITVPGAVADGDWGLIFICNAGVVADCSLTTPAGWTVAQAHTNMGGTGTGSYAVYKRQRQTGDGNVTITKGNTTTPVTVNAVWYSASSGFGVVGSGTWRSSSVVSSTAVAHGTGSGFTSSLALFAGKTSTSATVDAGTVRSQRYYGASAGHPYSFISDYTGATATRTLTSSTASGSGGGLQIAVLDDGVVNNVTVNDAVGITDTDSPITLGIETSVNDSVNISENLNYTAANTVNVTINDSVGVTDVASKLLILNNMSVADRSMLGLIAAGFVTGSIADRELAYLTSKTALPATFADKAVDTGKTPRPYLGDYS